MSTHKTIFITGILILITPFLGLPTSIESFINSVLAIFLIVIAILLKLKNQSSQAVDDGVESVHQQEVFTETDPETESEPEPEFEIGPEEREAEEIIEEEPEEIIEQEDDKESKEQ